MNLIVTSSPHICGKETTARIMADVLLALMPALVVGICVQGLRALTVTLVTVVACLAGEALMQCNRKTPAEARFCGCLLLGFTPSPFRRD